MVNYLKRTKVVQNQKTDLGNYSLSNNDISDEYQILPEINRDKLLKLATKYPDYKYTKLINALRLHFKIKNIVLGSGSEDLIIRINLLLKKKGRIGILYPVFYRIAETAGRHKKIYTSYTKSSEFFDMDIVYKEINRGLKALWIVNPNPMIGKVCKKQKIVKLVKDYPNILFIVDESAINFVENSKFFTVIDLAQRLNNLIVLRSFSKLYGLAGLRVGLATGNNDILNNVKNIGTTFPVNSIAEYFVLDVLKKTRVFQKIRRRIEKHKLLLEKLLIGHPSIIFSKSVTNCLFFGHTSKDIFRELLRFGVISLKLGDHDGVREKNFVRITVHSSQKLFDDLFLRLNRFVKNV